MDQLDKALKGRKVDAVVLLDEGPQKKFCMTFEDGIFLTLWVDEDAILCVDVDRQARQ